MSTEERGPAQQRQFYRAPVDFPVTANLEGSDDPLAAHAHDLSGAGIRISMDGNLDRGQPLQVKFRLPSGMPEIKAFGLVVLSYFEGSSGRYFHGIAFTRISVGDREAIVHYIHEVQTRSLKS